MGIPLKGRFTGQVIKYNVEKGFGFIKVFDREIIEDAFIHYSEIEKEVNSFKKLLPNQNVEFNLLRNDRGLIATNLIRKTDGNY